MVEELVAKYSAPFERSGTEDPFRLRAKLQECNWNKVGVVRNGQDMEDAIDFIGSIRSKAANVKVSGPRTYNMPWNTYIDFMNMLDVSYMAAASALARKESRAAHYRSDFPDQDDDNGLINIFLIRDRDGMPELYTEPVDFKYKTLQECQSYQKY